MTRVLVTGVSGEVGSRLARRLAASESIGSLVGIDTQPLAGSIPKMTFHLADATSLDEFSVHLQDVDVVVHLAPPSASNGFQVMLDACAAAGIKRFVLASSTAVYGAWPDNDFPLLESSRLRPNPGFAIAASFAEQERRLESLPAGIEISVLRMATLMGTERRDKLVWGALTRVDWNSSRPMQFLNVDDAVRAFALVIENELGGVFNVAADFLGSAQARELCGLRPVPVMPRSLAHGLDAINWQRRRYPDDFVRAGKYLQHPWVVSSEALRSHGWVPEFSSSEALVAFDRPSGWDRLRPGQRRALISGALFAAPVLGAVLAAILTGRAVRSGNFLKR